MKVLWKTPSMLVYLKRIIYSLGSKILFLSLMSFTLSFSSFSNYSRERLLTNSVKAASYIISRGVSFSFLSSSDHLDCASMPSMRSQSGLANEPSGALAYLGLFFFSPPSPSTYSVDAAAGPSPSLTSPSTAAIDRFFDGLS